MDRQAVSKVLKLNPSLFGSSVDNSLEPKLVWLREGLGLEERDIALVVRACPNILRQERCHGERKLHANKKNVKGHWRTLAT